MAVGGSNGKTSTKELVRAALGARLSVHATTGNLNNQVGVPLTLLALPDDADIAVIEVGTNMPGEIALLYAPLAGFFVGGYVAYNQAAFAGYFGRAHLGAMTGDASFTAGLPESFNVLIRELQSLCLDVELMKTKKPPVEIAPEPVLEEV